MVNENGKPNLKGEKSPYFRSIVAAGHLAGSTEAGGVMLVLFSEGLDLPDDFNSVYAEEGEPTLNPSVVYEFQVFLSKEHVKELEKMFKEISDDDLET